MRLRNHNIGPPGGWVAKCPDCVKTFASATFSGLVGEVGKHIHEVGHTYHPLLAIEIEAAICNRLSATDYAQYCIADGAWFANAPYCSTNTILLLGRYGDIVNLLPFAYGLSRNSFVKWIVNKDFADILEGVSYVTPKAIDYTPDQLKFAFIDSYQMNPRVAQCWQNPDGPRHLTESFCMESWRLAGGLDQWNRWPLVFDQRSPEREKKLVKRVIGEVISPIVLVATESVSSPFSKKKELLESLYDLPAQVIDLSAVSAEKPYDLLALIEAADCLVTVDSLYLHLARACNTPVIPITRPDWLGSVPPPQTVRGAFRYNSDVKIITDTVADIISRPKLSYVVTGNLFGADVRHHNAQLTWSEIHYYAHSLARSSKAIGDSRDLPYAKDILQQALDNTNRDLIVLSNSDVQFRPDTASRICEHARRFDFGCARRAAGHQGREIYWFTRTWLQRNIATMPDVILGAPKCDFVLARWLRGFRGIPTDMRNLFFDMPPVELPAGLIHHEEHTSAWLTHQNSASAKHNEKLWML
jgi:hypothetical protein